MVMLHFILSFIAALLVLGFAFGLIGTAFHLLGRLLSPIVTVETVMAAGVVALLALFGD